MNVLQILNSLLYHSELNAKHINENIVKIYALRVYYRIIYNSKQFEINKIWSCLSSFWHESRKQYYKAI